MLDEGALDKLLLKDQLLQTMPTHKTFRGFREVHMFGGKLTD